tara:strand:+ start:49 stop:669 length:621 start_codon:yes stop_codon:yes gene_type:complete
MNIILDHFPNLSDDQKNKFQELAKIYKFWNSKINVISRKDIDNIYLHHILHSLSIAKFIEFKKGTSIVDLGTGGGFPGVPLSIFFPECNFNLVDSVKKKVDVVNAVSKDLNLKNIITYKSRAEDLNLKYDFIVSRAVAKIPKLLKWSKNCYNPDSKNSIKNGIIALKGGDLNEELKSIRYKTIVNLDEIFDYEYFHQKKIVYIPQN